MQCTLCDRESDDSLLFEDHHLFPGKNRRKKTNRKNDTILVCTTCGDQIHLMFDNKRLRTELDNLESLKEAMATYINWIQKRPIENALTMKRKKRRL